VLLETLQYEKELMDAEVKGEAVAKWYRENPQEMQKLVERLNLLKNKVATSKIRDSYKDSIIKGADRTLEILKYKPAAQESVQPVAQIQTKDSLLSYIIPAGLMLIPLILNEIFPERRGVEKYEPSGKD